MTVAQAYAAAASAAIKGNSHSKSVGVEHEDGPPLAHILVRQSRRAAWHLVTTGTNRVANSPVIGTITSNSSA